MIIHVVKTGETIDQIAETYGKSAESIIRENELANPYKLVVGQAIVIVYPQKIYTIQEGDTLSGIAYTFHVPLMQLLRNNPYLSKREFIYPGETIVISYEEKPMPAISTNGYAFPYIDKSILRKTLPFLTYLSIFCYSVSPEGSLLMIDDMEVIRLAKEYGVAPIMVLSNITENGTESSDLLKNLLSNQVRLDTLVNSLLEVLKEKGYYGINLDVPSIPPEFMEAFYHLVIELTNRFHKENFKVFLTLTPVTFEIETTTNHDIIDYTLIDQQIDGVNLLSYSWGRSDNIPIEIIPFYILRFILNLNYKYGRLEKTTIGITTIGYIWDIPYIEGASNTSSITDTNAILLASEAGSEIYYNKANQISYFYIFRNNENNYLVYFHDARGIDALTKLVPEYGLNGITIWNIMNYFAQLFLLINVQYSIVKIPPETIPSPVEITKEQGT